MIDLKEIAKTMTKEEFMKKHIVDDGRGCHLMCDKQRYECPDELGLRTDNRCEYDTEYWKYCGECWDRGLLKLEFKEEEVKKDTYTLLELSNMEDNIKFKSINDIDNEIMFFEDGGLFVISEHMAGEVDITFSMLKDTYVLHVDPIYIPFAEAMEQLQEGKTIGSLETHNQYNIVNGILHRNGKPLLPKHTSYILYEEIIGEWVVM